MHGEPYQPGNLVWLHSTVCKGHEGKKLHYPCTGPYEVIKRLAETTYRIHDIERRGKRKVVHFNRLKSCKQPTSMSEVIPQTPGEDCENTNNSPPTKLKAIGTDLHLVESQDTELTSQIQAAEVVTELANGALSSPRYPTRIRRPPSQYRDSGNLVPNTYSQKRGDD